MKIPLHFYPRRCFFIGHSKCLAKGDYNKCKMMAPFKGGFIVPDDREIYDEQECEYFAWNNR